MTLPIHSAATNHPEQIAFDDGVTQITYANLSDELGGYSFAGSAKITHGDHVAWCPRNDVDAFLAFWALQQRGCVTCPISFRFPDVKRRDIVKRMGAKWLPSLVDSGTRGLPMNSSDSINCSANRLATIILSSGSTGVPKAIAHSMNAHVASAIGAAQNMPLNPGDRWLWSLPLFHVSGLSILIRCAVAGATLVGKPNRDPLNAAVLNELRITHLSAVNVQLRRLLAEDNFPSPHLKSVLLGGSSVDPELVVAARQRGIQVHTTYGLTETASQVTTSTATGNPTASGQVLPGRELKISETGEILVRGETLCLGYFRSGKIHPVVNEDGWFHTKDLGRLDNDHQLSVIGRIDNMFISGGENIYPESIERAMLRAFDIEQVVVVPKSDDAFGARPVAFINGKLPDDWETILRSKVQGYEIPIEIRSWPPEAEGAIKPNRNQLKMLLSGQK